MATISDTRTTMQTISGVGSTLEVTETGFIAVTGGNDGIRALDDQATINVDGFVRATYDYAQSGIYALKSAEITIGKDGFAQGSWAGVRAGGSLILTNNGRIDNLGFNGSGVSASANLVLENNGTITGYGGVVLGSGEITNHGTIIAAEVAISATTIPGSGIVLINDGRIWGRDAAVDGTNLRENITNSGKIIGDIKLLGDNDFVDMRGGSINGRILGGQGADTLITDSAKIKLTEVSTDVNDDTVKSTVNYTLSTAVEILRLIGNKNIDGTGTDTGDNYLYGNDADNVLKGKNGYNEFYGMGGEDKMIGGTDIDFFGFGKGFGRDTVTNFENGEDQINMVNFGPMSFDALKSDIEKHGDDTWINLGKGDVLILQNVNPNALDANDFTFTFTGSL